MKGKFLARVTMFGFLAASAIVDGGGGDNGGGGGPGRPNDPETPIQIR